MLDWLSRVSEFSVFLAISALGFVFLLVSLICGEIFEHFGGDSFDLHVDHGGPGFFSTRVVSVFVTAFGGFGALGMHYGLSLLAASGLGWPAGYASPGSFTSSRASFSCASEIFLLVPDLAV